MSDVNVNTLKLKMRVGSSQSLFHFRSTVQSQKICVLQLIQMSSILTQNASTERVNTLLHNTATVCHVFGWIWTSCPAQRRCERWTWERRVEVSLGFDRCGDKHTCTISGSTTGFDAAVKVKSTLTVHSGTFSWFYLQLWRLPRWTFYQLRLHTRLWRTTSVRHLFCLGSLREQLRVLQRGSPL